ncbi:hypothetical protein FD20_GL002512 [Liquorilactobacillus uvarum DSM 19971]|uniref:Uncharacterized protein n=1 Tax=Liquorilactobacillus uvarum DSM 19971 TaxID=1423812 RepID=A0A0R1Q5T6_9LACO|nr:hypothetical protein FD20_GL002512 [Liquorilactobacillus uvarum DSM 19971]
MITVSPDFDFRIFVGYNGVIETRRLSSQITSRDVLLAERHKNLMNWNCIEEISIIE